jgi:hypothetical protein
MLRVVNSLSLSLPVPIDKLIDDSRPYDAVEMKPLSFFSGGVALLYRLLTLASSGTLST